MNGFTIRGGQGLYGGGIYAVSTNNGLIYISNCIIEMNGGGDTEAGGIYIQAGTSSMIYNTVVAKNMGEVGAIYDVNGSLIWNCTIVSNTTLDTSLGAVTGGSGAPNIRNSIIWSNGFDAIDLYFANADYSTFGSNEFVTAGLHNLSVDPILVNMLFGNYRLQTNSPVVGAGISLPIEQRDLYGNSRPVTGRFDIGANEYTDSLGDGMQDDWKIKHGLSTTMSQASLDPDGDGLNNLQEYNNNSDPHNPDTDGDGISDGPTVPPGSGLQSGPDPNPTTPDLSWNTIFWDYYFASQFQLYIDGIANPQWINEPYTRPCGVVINNNHIGDHVDLQWQYLGGPGYPPFLVFFVPLPTHGVVIPDLDAVPLNQIQFGFGDLAPPDGPWGFTLAQTTPTNADVCAGFDDETPLFFPGTLPALSVPQGGTNTLSVIIDPTNVVGQIVLRMTNTVTASVSPSSTANATQSVSIVSLTGGGIITNEFTVLGYGAQNTYTTTCSQVAVDILPKKTNQTVAIYKVVAATMTNNPPVEAPTQAELKDYLDQVYGKQANVYMNVLTQTTVTVNYDLNSDTYLNWTSPDLSPEESAITGAVYTAGAINVYYVHAMTGPVILAGAITHVAPQVIFVQDFLNLNSNVNVTAHEIGHALGLVHPNNPGQLVTGKPDRLMWLGEDGSNPCRLIRSEWQKVNDNAK